LTITVFLDSILFMVPLTGPKAVRKQRFPDVARQHS
jgi:hypothetical protein